MKVVPLIFIASVLFLVACSKEEDSDSKKSSSSKAQEEIVVSVKSQVSPATEIALADEIEALHSVQKSLTEKAGIPGDPNVPISNEPCTKKKTVSTNLYTSKVGTYEHPGGVKIRMTRSCVAVKENGKEVLRWTYWKGADGNYYAPDEVATKVTYYKYQSCKYALKNYSHKAKVATIQFYLSEQGTLVSPCEAIAIEKDGICDDGQIIWKAKDKNVTNADEYQYLSCADYGKAPTYMGCEAEDGQIYAVGKLVDRVNMYSSDFCSNYQGCRQLKELYCQDNGQVAPREDWQKYAALYAKEDRVVLPDSVYVIDRFGSKKISQIGACGNHMFVVAQEPQAGVDPNSVTLQGIYIFDQREKADSADHRRPSTVFYNSAVFTQMDNLTCIDQRYLAGTQRVATTLQSFNNSHTDIFLIDLERFNKVNGMAAAHSSGAGFGDKIKKLSLKVPNFRDQAKLEEVDDVQLDTVKVVKGKNQLSLLFMSYDTTIYAATIDLNADGSFPVNYLSLNSWKVDSNYNERQKYYNTSIYDVGDQSGNFYVVKKKATTSVPILLDCHVNKESFTCDALEIRNISAGSQIDFTFVTIDEVPYLMAWDTVSGKMQNLYQFKPVDGWFDGQSTALPSDQWKAVRERAAAIAQNRISAGDQYIFTQDHKVFWLTFNENNQLIAESLTPSALAAEKDLANYAHLADIEDYAAPIKQKLGDPSSVTISAKGTLPFYYLYVRPQDFENVIFKATPQGLKELIDTPLVRRN